MNEDCVKISRYYLLYFLRNKLSKSVTVEPGQSGRAGSSFKCSASPKMVINFYFNFFRFIIKGFRAV